MAIETVSKASDKGDPKIQKALAELDGVVNYLSGSINDLVGQLTPVRTDLVSSDTVAQDVHIVQSPMADQVVEIAGKVRAMCYVTQELMKRLEV